MQFPSKDQIERLRKIYPVGCSVRLVRMSDPQSPPPGTEGRVLFVDDIGTVHVAWNTGSSLGIIPGEDYVEIV